MHQFLEKRFGGGVERVVGTFGSIPREGGGAFCSLRSIFANVWEIGIAKLERSNAAKRNHDAATVKGLERIVIIDYGYHGVEDR